MPNKNNQKDDCGENIFLTSSEQERYMHFLQAKSHTQKNAKGVLVFLVSMLGLSNAKFVKNGYKKTRIQCLQNTE